MAGRGEKSSADPRLPIEAVIWVERRDQNGHKSTNKLLYHSLGKRYGHGCGCGVVGAVAPRPEGFAPSDLLQHVAHPRRVLEVRCCSVAVLSTVCFECDPNEIF